MNNSAFNNDISHANEILGLESDGPYKRSPHLSNADFVEYEEKESSMFNFEKKEPEMKNEVAVYDPNMYRHPLLADKETDYVKEGIEELEMDKKLGLKNQENITGKTILQKDIDELTRVNDFHEVDRPTIEKLFEIPKLKRMCWVHNAKVAIKEVFKQQKFTPLFAIGTVGLIILAVHLGIITKNISSEYGSMFSVIGCVASCIGAVVCLICTINEIFDSKTYVFSYMNVELHGEPLNRTNIKIPRGAKLRTVEAMESKIFEEFVIFTPKFTIEHEVIKPKQRLDPAICGVTKDERMFMIVYWDIEHDKEKIIKDIKRYKKFKL